MAEARKGMRKYPRAESNMPPAKAERTIREKRRFAFSVCPSPMVFATRALPPEPNMNPTQAKTMMAGKIRLTAVNAVLPT